MAGFVGIRSLGGQAANRLPFSRHDPCRNADRSGASGNISDNKRISSDRCIIADSHRADDARVATDPNVIPDDSSGLSGVLPDRAYVVEGAVGPDLCVTMHANGTGMTNEQARADLGSMIHAYLRYYCK